MAFRKDVFEEVGGFDESYKGCGSSLDFAGIMQLKVILPGVVGLASGLVL